MNIQKLLDGQKLESCWIPLLGHGIHVSSNVEDRLQRLCEQFPLCVRTKRKEMASDLHIIDMIVHRREASASQFFKVKDGTICCVSSAVDDIEPIKTAMRWLIRIYAPLWEFHVYHGAVVQKDRTGLLIVGTGGAGKTVLALAMVFLCDYRFVADDLVCLAMNRKEGLKATGIGSFFRVFDGFFELCGVNAGRSVTVLSNSSDERDKRSYLLDFNLCVEECLVTHVIEVTTHELCKQPSFMLLTNGRAKEWLRRYHWCEMSGSFCRGIPSDESWSERYSGPVYVVLLGYNIAENVQAVKELLRNTS